MKNNPGTQIEIAVHRDSWVADSVLYIDEDSILHQDTIRVFQADVANIVQIDTSGILETDTSFLEESLLAKSGLLTLDSLQIPLDTLQIPKDTIVEPMPDPTEIQAQAISRYLQERGVPEYLLEPKGYADSQPVAPNDTEEQRLLNRRVEVIVL